MHPDLAPNAWVNTGEIPNNGIDDDGNGFVDDVHGFNFGDGSADLTDSNGHGTHVAAIVAAAGVHMVSGVAPRAKIMCLKVQDSDGALFASYIFSAYQYAQDMGAHIIVNSFSNTYWAVPNELPGEPCCRMLLLLLLQWAGGCDGLHSMSGHGPEVNHRCCCSAKALSSDCSIRGCNAFSQQLWDPRVCCCWQRAGQQR